MTIVVTAELFQRAIEYAARKHRGQYRKGDGKPYIIHPMSVMCRLMKIKPKSTNLYLLGIVIILHDVVEDCGVTIKEIAKLFGYQVASLVAELTTDKDECAAMGKINYMIVKMMKMSSYGLRCKLLDIWDNMEDMVSSTPQFQAKMWNEKKAILEGIKSRKLTPTHNLIIANIHEALIPYTPVEIKVANKT